MNYKTFIPAVIGLAVLVYEAETGHKVDEDAKTQLINGSISFVGWAVTLWGIYKNHKKEVQK